MRLAVGSVVLSTAVLLSLQAVSSVEAVNPGFRIIVTQKALDYARQRGLPLLKEKLGNLTIAPITGTSAGFEYTISNMMIDSLDFGDSTLTTSSKEGVVFTAKEISLSLSVDWSYEGVHWPHLKSHGSVDVSGSGISLGVSVDLKENKTSGGFFLDLTSCSFNIGSLDLHFHGGASWIYDLLGKLFQNKLQELLNDKICSGATHWINTQANEKSSSFPVVSRVDARVQINYALVNNPDFSHAGYIVTNHKGMFELTENPQDPPFSPPSLPDPSGNYSKMIYVHASTYVVESAFYAFWKSGLLAYNLTKDEIPSGFDTTALYCTIVSQELCKKFPRKKIMFGITAPDYPRLNITEKFASMSAKAYVSMYVHVDNDGHEETAFTLELNMVADARAMLRRSADGKYFISGNISNPRVNVTLAKSNIGDFNVSTLRGMITTFIDTLGLIYINNYTTTGFPIPMVDGLSFTDPSLDLGNGFVKVSGDIEYSPQHSLKKLNSKSMNYL